jgi:hypothetical protein
VLDRIRAVLDDVSEAFVERRAMVVKFGEVLERFSE